MVDPTRSVRVLVIGAGPTPIPDSFRDGGAVRSTGESSRTPRYFLMAELKSSCESGETCAFRAADSSDIDQNGGVSGQQAGEADECDVPDGRGRWIHPVRPDRRQFLAASVVVVAGAVAGGAAVAPEPDGTREPARRAAFAADSAEVSIFPMPGTVTAHPRTGFSFRGVSVADLSAVTVTGSSSGAHTGDLVAHADGSGATFVPDEVFDEGETVTVTAPVSIRGADGSSCQVDIARLAPRPQAAGPVTQALQNGVSDFVSAPGISPPVIEVVQPAEDIDDGYIVIGPKNGYSQKGPMILDYSGELVWFHPLDGVDARDVKVQTYQGEPVITWWEGEQVSGFGYGEAVVVGQDYREIARFGMGNGYTCDAHEVQLTEAGTALLVGYEPVWMDMSAWGGSSRAQVVDCVVQEVDVSDGAVLLEWHSIGQIGIEESYIEFTGEGQYDFLHLNAIAVDTDGSLLISARHTCAAYFLDRDTGSVLRRLGGKLSDYALPDDGVFILQHHVRRQDDGSISIFDNGGERGDITREWTRGLYLDLDEDAMTATVAGEIHHPEKVFAETQGSFQTLPGGDVFFGWGQLPRFSRLDANGKLLFDAQISPDINSTSYRADHAVWTGLPTWDPAAVASAGTGLKPDDDAGAAIHASWNGATQVASWRVRDRDTNRVLVSRSRTGFETTLHLAGSALQQLSGLRVEALDSAGTVLGSTVLS